MSEGNVRILKNIDKFAQRLDVGGEPPDNGDMDARFSKIEDRLGQMDGRLTRVEVKLDHIEKEVSNFKWWLIGAVLTIVLTTVGVVVGTGVGIQQMTVSTFQAAGAHAQQPTATQPPIIINVPAQVAPQK